MPRALHTAGPEGRPYVRNVTRGARFYGREPGGRREITVDKYGQEHQDRKSSRPRDEGSTARRLIWALLGVIAYAVAKYIFGF